ncbi:hypothetical protein N0V82_005953 [Gnomoniopsis sp. IMI 355080]|nr:hypothetical protein N0V82_005953 [Gnomoniopsis sp. IMI 355080]
MVQLDGKAPPQHTPGHMVKNTRHEIHVLSKLQMESVKALHEIRALPNSMRRETQSVPMVSARKLRVVAQAGARQNTAMTCMEANSID